MQFSSAAACVQGKVSGQLRVFFYDTEAGSRDVGPVVVPARASPQASAVSQPTPPAAPALSSAAACLWVTCAAAAFRSPVAWPLSHDYVQDMLPEITVYEVLDVRALLQDQF